MEAIKSAIELYVTIIGRPTDKLCVYLLKLIDLLERYDDNECGRLAVLIVDQLVAELRAHGVAVEVSPDILAKRHRPPEYINAVSAAIGKALAGHEV